MRVRDCTCSEATTILEPLIRSLISRGVKVSNSSGRSIRHVRVWYQPMSESGEVSSSYGVEVLIWFSEEMP